MTAAPKPRNSKLKGKAPELIKASRPRVLIYGISGVGKTTWALSFPDVYLIDAEGGATQPEYREKLRQSGGLYLGPEDGANSFDVVMEQIKILATEPHDRKTLVLDSVTKLFATEIAREAERLTDSGKKNEFGADRKPAVNYMRQLTSWLGRINMNVILIAGEVAEWGTDSKGERAQIGQTFDAWPRLEYELDLAINVLKLGGRRIGKVRKSRIAAFPQASTFEWTYAEFAQLYGRDIVEEESVPIECATAEQLAEINRLLGIVKLEDGTVDKWLAAANVSAWDEMPMERAEKAITHLKGRIAL
jgi:RecA/RadA recombinase